jgi:DNA-directed RNA polymerase specialized sigma24 family protein
MEAALVARATAAIAALPALTRQIAEAVHVHGWEPCVLARRLGADRSEIMDHLAADRAARQLLAAAVVPVSAAGPRQNRPSRSAAAQEARRLANEGIRPAEIAARVGLTARTVADELRLARRAGMACPTFCRGTLSRSDAVRLALGGLAPMQIAAKLGCKPKAVHEALSHARASGVAVPRFKSGRAPCSGRGRPAPVSTPTSTRTQEIV